jgi:diguanylate cyclase (GGDEF)-like protein
MLLAVVAGVAGVWAGSKTAITANFRRELLDLARTAATLVDPDLHERIRRPEQLNDPDYVAAVSGLRRMREAVPDIHYLYTLVRDGKDVRFVLDAADPGLMSPGRTPEQRARLAAEALAVAAQTDKLTELATRTVFIERLEAALIRVREGQQAWVTVLFLDFDRFKLVNDSLGHEAGDALLRNISSRLREWLQAHHQTAAGSGPNLICRFGGDEFLILLNDLREPHEAREVAAQLLARLARPYSVLGNEVHSTASIGIVGSNTGREHAADLIRNADVAMYEAKRSGRARSVEFDESMRESLERQLLLETALRRAIATQELYLEYQPIVDLATGQQMYVEALLRWRHPTLGNIAPGEFIPIAEDSGLIVEVGRWVRRAACRQMAIWLKSTPATAPSMVSVNVSRAELALGLPLLEEIETELQSSGLPPACLQLEVTEREVMRDPQAALHLLQQLRALGVRLAMDDFGSGNSSLSLLRDLPFGAIKIDRSFLQDSYTKREVLAVIQATIQLIENLGMISIAEGVEDSTQVSMLQSLGCQGAQGYYFGQPMSAESVVSITCAATARRLFS